MSDVLNRWVLTYTDIKEQEGISVKCQLYICRQSVMNKSEGVGSLCSEVQVEVQWVWVWGGSGGRLGQGSVWRG